MGKWGNGEEKATPSFDAVVRIVTSELINIRKALNLPLFPFPPFPLMFLRYFYIELAAGENEIGPFAAFHVLGSGLGKGGDQNG
jgi:hypothetical protein